MSEHNLRIRSMRTDEISIAVDWAAAEGWNPGLADAACFSRVDPDGFLIGELDGAPVATVSCVNYSASFALLGLYIVRSIARAHGGRVFAQSEGEGRGATFTLELPRLAS